MSALECHLKAAHCEEMARSCADPIDRNMLLDVAAIWRKLAIMRPILSRELMPDAL